MVHMSNARVAVVGGGTIGNYLASLLSKKNVEVDVYEENGSIGVPQHCSGLISISGLKKIGTWSILEKKNLILNKIRGARFYGKSGKYRVVYFDEPVAVVIDRIKYDQALYDLAEKSGARYFLQTSVKRISPNGYLKAVKKGRIIEKKYDVIVDSEGATRRLIRDFPGVNSKGLLPAVQLDIKIRSNKVDVPSDVVELHFNVNDFFTWVIPLDEEKHYRVGVATSDLMIPHIEFVKKFAKKRLGSYKTLRMFGGLVVSNGPLKKFTWEKVIAVGDAAGHVKPTTGGGVVLGSLGAIIASRIIYSHLENKLDLSTFQVAYTRYLKLQFFAMKTARKLLNILGQNGTDIALKIIPQVIFSNLRGDMDMQLGAFLKLMFPFIPFKDKNE